MDPAQETEVLRHTSNRDSLQKLKEEICEEMSTILEAKLSTLNCDDLSDVVLCDKDHGGKAFPKEKRKMSLDASEAWSPGFSRSLRSSKRTDKVTKALTRSHSTKKLQGRKYVGRPSLLTELLEVSHISSLYNMFVAVMILLLCNTFLHEALTTGTVNLGLDMLFWLFGGMEHVTFIWLGMFIGSSVVLHSGLHLWSKHRTLHPRGFDWGFAGLFVAYLTCLMYIPVNRMLYHNLPIASSFIVLCEQVRFFMKSWAFVRSNLWRPLHVAEKSKTVSAESPSKAVDRSSAADRPASDGDRPALRNRHHQQQATLPEVAEESEKTVALCPNFSDHLYFLFAPTLVYRENYPMNDGVAWRDVCVDFAQVLGCVFYAHFLFMRYCVPVFRPFGDGETMSLSQLTLVVFAACFPAFLVMLCTFFAVLHAWMNAFAEMTRFADRMFYKDWWNSHSYAGFYRTWNCVVHDWLYEYVYMEAHRALPSGKLQKTGSMLLVFLISSVVHEYIIGLAFRFFYPVLLLLFGVFGVAFFFIRTRGRQFNVVLWTTLILGAGILMCLYSLEWYARQNCARLHDGPMDYVIPRSWFCVPKLASEPEVEKILS